MKINSFLVLGLLLSTTSASLAHGPAHMARNVEQTQINEVVGDQAVGVPISQEVAERWWAAEATTGWESRHVHYGVNETGSSGAYVNEVGIQLGDLAINVWNGFGIGNSFNEWDFTIGYNVEIGPVFIIPGYNFRYMAGHVEPSGHAHHEEEHHEEEHEEEHHDHEEENGSHAHSTYGNELFLTIGTTAIPYVIPSANFIWDLNNTPGAFLEFRVDGDIPVYGETFSLQPYTTLGLNFGYNTMDYYGWNNFQFGLQGTFQITRYVAAFAGVNYSVALEALQQIQQDNVFWINVGLSFAY